MYCWFLLVTVVYSRFFFFFSLDREWGLGSKWVVFCDLSFFCRNCWFVSNTLPVYLLHTSFDDDFFFLHLLFFFERGGMRGEGGSGEWRGKVGEGE